MASNFRLLCRVRKLHVRAAQLADAARRLSVDCASARPDAPPGRWVELTDIENAARDVGRYAAGAVSRLAVFVGGQPQRADRAAGGGK